MDIQTLSVMQGLLFALQVLILFIQYATNRTFKELGWWAMGSLTMALGILFMPLVKYPNWFLLAALSNPLFIGGHFLVAIGLIRFIKKQVNLRQMLLLFVVYVFGYYFFLFAMPNLSMRTMFSNGWLGGITLFTAYHLLKIERQKSDMIRRFMGVVFLMAGLFFTFRTIRVLFYYPLQSYEDMRPVLVLAFVLPIVFSTLWTYGLVLMVNHRLSEANLMEKRKLLTVFNTSPDATLIMKFSDGTIVDANKGLVDMYGFELSEVIGNTDIEMNIWNDMSQRDMIYRQLHEHQFCRDEEVTFTKKNGNIFEGVLSCQVATIDDERMAVCTIHDITERKRAEDKIRQLNSELEFERNLAHMNSMTDSLTGLANRRMFDETLFDTINLMKEIEQPLSLIMMDIDYFKAFNDKHGHVVGDYALEELGEVLGRLPVTEGILAARYGGEEFAIILPKVSSQEAVAIATHIKQEVESLIIIIEESSEEANLTVSLGVITIPASKLNYPKDVVVLADKALYIAKEKGRNRVEALIM